MWALRFIRRAGIGGNKSSHDLNTQSVGIEKWLEVATPLLEVMNEDHEAQEVESFYAIQEGTKFLQFCCLAFHEPLVSGGRELAE